MFAFATTSTATPVAKVRIRIFLHPVSHSRVSTWTSDDASGASRTTDEASVFPPTWSRAVSRADPSRGDARAMRTSERAGE